MDPPFAEVTLQSRNRSDVDGVAGLWEVALGYIDMEVQLSSGESVVRPAAIHHAKSCGGILGKHVDLSPVERGFSETRLVPGAAAEIEDGEHAVVLLFGEDDPRLAACGMIAFRQEEADRGCERINCGRPDRCTPGPPATPTPRSCPSCPTPDPRRYCCPCIPR